MKASAALALCIAPLALAKVAHNAFPHARRSQQLDARENNNEARNKASKGSAVVVNAGTSPNKVTGLSPQELALLGISGTGITPNARTEVIFLWVNIGGGSPTTVINEAVTTTVTVNAGGGQAVATTPPPAVGGGEAATTTAPAGEPATSAAPAGPGQTHSVIVGGAAAGLTFVPAQISANIGDTVIFTFNAQNHTATQSAFDTPCSPLEGGMDSGFQANPNNTVNPPPQVAMQVMVDTPLWFYCKQGNHCGKGMTFSINPTAEKTQAMFQAKAIAQNGAGAGGAITGNAPAGGAAPPAAAPPAAAPPAESPAAAPPAGEAAATPPAAGGEPAATNTNLAAVPTGFAVGNGQVDPGSGACVCAVTCATTSFGGVAVGAQFGGVQSEIPASMLGVGA
ncbi:hypothetical protein GE09DRAFT_1246510 [Coniochaeta sp. 2T2.1]|nr:hypothetical protein GE09DRAFT_1246510 [Coniochaeta sp. 2T2.1]